MTEIVFLLPLAVLALAGIAATVHAVARDGLRRIPTRGVER